MLQQVTRENFYATLERFSTNQLESLIEQYPYFHQAHLLLAKKYQLEGHYKFDEQLQLAALYTQDREMFFSIFNQNDIKRVPDAVAQVWQTQQVETDNTETAPVAPVVEQHIEETIITETNLSPQATEVVTVEETHAFPEYKVEPVAELKPVVEETDTTVTEPQQVIEAEDEVVLQEPVKNVPVVETAPAEVEEVFVIETETNAVTDVIEEPQQILEAEAEQPETAVEEEDEPVLHDEPRSFDDWLTAFGKLNLPADITTPAAETKTVEEQDAELEKTIMQSVPVNYLHGLVEEETQYSKGLSNFIEEQIQKRRHVEVVKPASENDIDPALITETLAKLYEMQKKYAKAIKAYEALSVKNPEKVELYAARINYIKSLI